MTYFIQKKYPIYERYTSELDSTCKVVDCRQLKTTGRINSLSLTHHL
jgi:hypothetical protein